MMIPDTVRYNEESKATLFLIKIPIIIVFEIIILRKNNLNAMRRASLYSSLKMKVCQYNIFCFF